MRVLLAGPDHEENLSIRYLSSSLLTAGHYATLAAFNSPADMTEVANAARNAEIVGLSMCFQSRAREFLDLARLIKSRDPSKLVVAGGHYASCAAEPLLSHHPELDIIVIHEGESTLVEIADALPRLQDRLPQIPGIAYRNGQRVLFTAPRTTLENLDALPFPDRRGPVHLLAGVPTSYLMGSRGCYGNCAYCCITTLHRMAPGKRFRQRRVDNIADEMAALYQERGTRQFVFHDDNFLVPSEAMNHARLSALEKALRRRRVKDIALVIKCRPADANRRVLRRLKELGLVRVFLGIESATTRGLASLEREQSVEDSERALETCSGLGISAQFTLMIFNPDATLDTLRSDLAFMRRYCGNPLNFCRAEIYAGTPLEKRMIELGRARGDYLARVYSLSDPAAERACHLALDLFDARCWSGGSLMQNAIGLDHVAAVAKRFYDGPRQRAICQRVAAWLRSVNLDTINRLEEVVELSASAASRDAGVEDAIFTIRERESATRAKLLAEGLGLRAELEELRFLTSPRPVSQPSRARFRLARQTAAAVLALGIPASGCQVGVSEMAPPPLKEGQTQEQSCSITGTVTDAMGAVIPNVEITVTNLDTGRTLDLTSDNTGKYVADKLSPGRYTVKAVAASFKTFVATGIVLKGGARQAVDIRLEVGGSSWPGCCEYAAAPLQVPTEDLIAKKKPFTYYVGQAHDHKTLRGVANVVYGDSRLWVQIFEANRNSITIPAVIYDGMALQIPPRKRDVPKLIFQVKPAYPPAAKQDHVWGDVLMDVTLKEDGTVDEVNLIDGAPLLAEAATAAVEKWRYKISPEQGKPPVLKFVVAVSFSKGGRVQ